MNGRPAPLLALAAAALLPWTASSFSSSAIVHNHASRGTVHHHHHHRRTAVTSGRSIGAAGRVAATALGSAAPSDTSVDDNIVPPSVGSAAERVEGCKRDLVRECADREIGDGRSSSVEGRIKELERLGEDAGFGQASSLSGLISGEW